jgi:hypothetical protein
MTDTLMRGPHTVRTALSLFLSIEVPRQVAIARTQWSLDAYQLPVPVRYDAYEPYALDKWPLMGVTVSSADGFTLNDMDALAQRKYRATYRVRLFTWVRTPLNSLEVPFTPEYDETLRLRDDLAACVRAALLQTSGLGDDALMWDESTLVEEYSEATPVKGDRFVAGVTHTLSVQVDETLILDYIGTAETIEALAEAGGPLAVFPLNFEV